MENESSVEGMGTLAKKTILITGGLGFIGGHLSDLLIRSKCKVIISYYYRDEQARYNLLKLNKKTTIVRSNILSLNQTLELISKYKIKYIVHLAAESQVTSAYYKPLNTLNTNVMGTAILLEAARTYGTEGIIIASSDKAYGKSNKPYREKDALFGDHPYNVSKSSADLIAQTYHKTYNLPVIVTRFGNVYGEADLHFDRLIPGICKAIVGKKVFEIRSDGKYSRDYINVKDVVSGYMFLIKNLKRFQGSVFNFSSSDNFSVMDVIFKIERVLGIKIAYRILNNAVNEIPSQHLIDEKIRKLGWQTKLNFEKTIPSIFSWYRSYLKK